MMVSDDGRRLAFDKRELAVLTGMMASEEKRPTFAALWLNGGRAEAWATDGHRAVMVELRRKPPAGDEGARSVAIPASTAHHVAKTAAAGDVVVFDVGGFHVMIELRRRITKTTKTTEIKSFEDIEAWTRVKHTATCASEGTSFQSLAFAFPSCNGRGAPGAVVALDPGLLAPVVALGGVTDGFVWLNIGDPLDPILVLAEGKDGSVWRVVVMPWRPAPGRVPPDREPPPAPPGVKAKRGKRGAKAKRAGKAASSPAQPPEPAPTLAPAAARGRRSAA